MDGTSALDLGSLEKARTKWLDARALAEARAVENRACSIHQRLSTVRPGPVTNPALEAPGMEPVARESLQSRSGGCKAHDQYA